MVHHDVWDYDAPSPTVLFDATIGGTTVHGIGEAAKTGWLYLLDRSNGKPLFPIPERPVPQSAYQKTWPTQPIPSMKPLVRQVPSAAQVASVAKAAGNPAALQVATHMFTPYGQTMMVTAPGPAGGTNWSPSSYSPLTHLFYVCAQNGVAGLSAEALPEPKPGANGAEPHDVGSLWAPGGGLNNPGVLSAIDVQTGAIVWQKQFPDSCYSGSAVTAGNVVFVGRNGGELQAYDARNGNLLWSFQTGAGANNVATVFRRANGHEALVFFAGGNALAATPHGNNLWMFGLDGTLGPADPPATGSGIQHAGAVPVPAPSAMDVKAIAADPGAGLFGANCSICHGANGRGGNGGPSLATIPAAKNLQHVISQVTNGGGGMPAFKTSLTPQEIDEVSAYVVKSITQ
jgi:glucose dehydrogenase/mono/diheme cytochrome c family protein